ncbi:nucleotide-diphospho-sugar transferase [Fadolivirus algeromassiliense]|jgi:hypothetical protein|uniref:Nucleotide-diphospho-sugar transferase n=1 Tax=Fadolivirus FV1/VV64 TaxID=3070911 RepID=A0A7D3R153_9VIRU|nr:nucleotide-diphospho-sugar transferase [Fadolivirus algeromassiliense]QKF94181.1 nucleotide-diphospho-sugar transferase [Fadolivirus FV1/VV64]
MKKVVYSCLFVNGPKKRDQPSINNKLEGWDYIMFTNIPDKLINTGWTPIQKPLVNNHPIYSAKHYKWCGHKYLSEYDIAIYVDAYMTPNHNVDWNNYANKVEVYGISNGIIMMKHPNRACIYSECNEIHKCRKDTKANMEKVINFLKLEGMPTNYGLTAAGLFIRHLKNNELNKFCEELFDLMLKFSYRDQSLLSYMFWKNKQQLNCQLTDKFYIRSGKMGDHSYI